MKVFFMQVDGCRATLLRSLMCGIVGLFIKDRALEGDLGRLIADMLCTMTARGPDSAGFAVYGQAVPGCLKLTLRAPSGYDFAALGERLRTVHPGSMSDLTVRDTHAVLTVKADCADAVASWIERASEAVDIVGRGSRMEVYKETGLPATVAARFHLEGRAGSHAIGHTRMATESAVTVQGAHPFTTGPDQCLVHNGSLSNHNRLRRLLVREGLRFVTENDTEVAAGYLSWRLRQGLSLGDALQAGLADFDGFYTFVVGTEIGFAVLRDPIAFKHAVMAETERYVAFGTEFRALAGLPGIGEARVWEPEPARVYLWERR